MPKIAAASAIALLLSATIAGAETADTCVAALAADPRTIYDASVGAVQPGTDLKDLLTGKTRALVQDGAVERGTARDSARAAFKCLELRQRAE